MSGFDRTCTVVCRTYDVLLSRVFVFLGLATNRLSFVTPIEQGFKSYSSRNRGRKKRGSVEPSPGTYVVAMWKLSRREPRPLAVRLVETDVLGLVMDVSLNSRLARGFFLAWVFPFFLLPALSFYRRVPKGRRCTGITDGAVIRTSSATTCALRAVCG